MKKIGLAIILNFLACLSYADLHLELTQGVNDAIPIAITPFAQDKQNVAGDTTLTQVVQNDLQDSGQFRVVTSNLFNQQPTQLSAVDFNYWRNKKINDLVIGHIAAESGDRYQVNFELIGLFNQPLNVLKTDPHQAVLLNDTFTTNSSGLRRLAHHISDLIFQQLTGVRGVFSTQIAYVLVQPRPGYPTRYSLEIADADGFNPRTLLVSNRPIMSPAWAPNGRQLAYVSFEKQDAAIYLQDIYSGNRQLISQFPGINGAPAFSPDGKKLALVLTLTGNPKIYSYDLTTKKLAQLTRGFSIDTEPNWAPDGKSIIFTSDRGGVPQIYRYDLASQNVSRLTFEGNYNARASFTPDGQSIVMMHRETGLFGIAIQDLQSGRLTVLTQSGDDESPSIAPNSKMIIYATQNAGRGVLAQISTNGHVKLRLPAREGSVREPVWSPFITH